MNKSKISGWKDVFNFTLKQTVKSKAYIVSFLIFMIMSVASMPIINLVKGDEEVVCHIQKVYVNDQSDLSDDKFLPDLTDDLFGNVEFVPLAENYDDLLKRIDDSENTSVVLDVNATIMGYTLNFTKANHGEVTKNETKALGALVVEAFDDFKLVAMNVSQDQFDFINSDCETKVYTADIDGNEVIEEDTKISDAQYWFIYAILFVVMMVTTMSGTQIASSIAGDKSTRVVEYLLTSIKPLALMVGKVLAMLVAVLFQIIFILIGAYASNEITAQVTGTESMLRQYLPAGILANLNIVNIIICLLVIALGLMFYATLAGVAGATVSKIEELNEGMTMFTVVVMVGAYVGIAAANVLMGSGDSPLVTFALLFPLSSPFLLPGAVLIGKVSTGLMIGSIALQILFVILIMTFAAKIYETLILHNGTTITLKKLIGMAKDMKKGAK